MERATTSALNDTTNNTYWSTSLHDGYLLSANENLSCRQLDPLISLSLSLVSFSIVASAIAAMHAFPCSLGGDDSLQGYKDDGTDLYPLLLVCILLPLGNGR